MSPDALFLARSLSPHILPHSSHSLFCFLLSCCSVSFLVCVVATLFRLFFLLLSSILHFVFFKPFSGCHCFFFSCVLTISPHFPSSDPSGPETSSFSAHRPFPPPKVLTLQHTALCAAVHTLGLWRGLVAKACLSPFQCHSWYVCWGWDK